MQALEFLISYWVDLKISCPTNYYNFLTPELTVRKFLLLSKNITNNVNLPNRPLRTISFLSSNLPTHSNGDAIVSYVPGSWNSIRYSQKNTFLQCKIMQLLESPQTTPIIYEYIIIYEIRKASRYLRHLFLSRYILYVQCYFLRNAGTRLCSVQCVVTWLYV